MDIAGYEMKAMYDPHPILAKRPGSKFSMYKYYHVRRACLPREVRQVPTPSGEGPDGLDMAFKKGEDATEIQRQAVQEKASLISCYSTGAASSSD